MAPKKKSKKKEEEPPVIEDEVLMATTDLEPEPEEVQFTDTSYTSASFESLPPVIVEEVKPVKKKKKKQEVEEEVVVKKASSEMFQWSEESLPVIEEQEKVEEPPPPPPKKKGKGKKKEVELIPEFEKPKNWKKMSKKERDQWMTERIEQWRAEKEAEKQAILAGAKEKRIALARERNELLAKDMAEQDVRRDILQKTSNLFHKYENQKIAYLNRKQFIAEWQQYLRCDGLPDPRVVTQMSTYLHIWRETGKCDDKELEKKCAEALPMLEMLEEIIANSRQYTARQVQNYNEVRLALREQIAGAIEIASYTLLRDMERYFKFETIKVATYQKEFKGLKLNLWVAVRMPTRKPRPVEPDSDPVELAFPALKVTVKLPTIIDGSCVCVRAALTTIDLLSESSRSYPLLMEKPKRYEDLFTFNVKEHEHMVQLKTEYDAVRTKFYKELNAKIKEIETFLKTNLYAPNEKEKEELDNLNMSEPPPLPDPREHIAELNEAEFKKFLKKCFIRTRTGEINLRKYRICGGVLNLDLIVTPPQPKRMRFGIWLTALQLPKTLQAMQYQVQYRAPSAPPPGVTRTPEEIEAEMKKTEAEYEKLALVHIELNQDVLWLEPPIVCQWHEQRKIWTSNYVNDYKYNEDKLTVQFRTGVLWPIGIATLKYSNLPYQGWDLRPDPKGKGVMVTVTGVCVTVTFNCFSNYVRLKSIANANTPALKDHFDKKYSVKRLVQLMKDAACDFFPDFDSYNHVEGSCPKEWVVERHLYHAMAYLSRAYNFQWSRWNATAGARNIILQLREAVDKKREGKLQLLLATPQRACILKANEMVQEFNMEPMEGLPFFPDLFTLNMSYGSVDARRATFEMKYKLVETVFELLQELKLCSYA